MTDGVDVFRSVDISESDGVVLQLLLPSAPALWINLLRLTYIDIYKIHKNILLELVPKTDLYSHSLSLSRFLSLSLSLIQTHTHTQTHTPTPTNTHRAILFKG